MSIPMVVECLEESARLSRRLAVEQADAIRQAASVVITAFRSGGKVFFFGNGGSAAEAQHFAAEFVGRFARERNPLPALALTADTSALTAIGNDYGFEKVFARQIQALGKPGDVAVALSTSGRSPNVLAGVRAARKQGLSTIGLLGGTGGLAADEVDIPVVVPSDNHARIQEGHLAIGHILCTVVDSELFSEESPSYDPGKLPPVPPSYSSSKVVDWDSLLHLRERWRKQGKTVVWTNGCFDLLHVGHLRSLQAARRFGDVLIVGLNSDASVRQLKGPERPIVPASERAELLAGLGCVDYVLVFNDLTPEAALLGLKPEVHCKGADYAPPQGKPIPEGPAVTSYGGRIEFLPLVPCISTSKRVDCIQKRGGMS